MNDRPSKSRRSNCEPCARSGLAPHRERAVLAKPSAVFPYVASCPPGRRRTVEPRAVPSAKLEHRRAPARPPPATTLALCEKSRSAPPATGARAGARLSPRLRAAMALLPGAAPGIRPVLVRRRLTRRHTGDASCPPSNFFPVLGICVAQHLDPPPRVLGTRPPHRPPILRLEGKARFRKNPRSNRRLTKPFGTHRSSKCATAA